MVSDAVSSSHGRQEYGTAALAPEGLRRAYREVAGRREAGARRRGATPPGMRGSPPDGDRKSTRLNSSHGYISYAVFCLKKKKQARRTTPTSASTEAAARECSARRGSG